MHLANSFNSPYGFADFFLKISCHFMIKNNYI